MSPFILAFYGLCGVCAVLFFATRKGGSSTPTDKSFFNFQRSYLLVYLMAAGADWLQGPHVYALYQSYNMTKHQIELLFVAGFGSSMIVGTVIGSFADKYGRRANCIVYGVLYGIGCLTKHSPNFWVLMCGRFLAGIATSILYSAFESWLVCEHFRRGFEESALSGLFSLSTLLNSVVAIGAGVVAQYFADSFGYVAPFDASFCVLMVMCVVVFFTWSENYGDKTHSLKEQFSAAVESVRADRKIVYLGLVQSLFEGSMYTFVLEWTPALASDSPDAHPIPHGYIFASFMVCIMIGSSVFSMLLKLTCVESFMRPVLLTAALALASPIILPDSQLCVFGAFLVFETCVGIFWPALGTMRSRYVPEQARATVMNLFRVPLNFIVIIILLQNIPRKAIFSFCTFFLCGAAFFQHLLLRSVPPPATPSISETSGEKKAPPVEYV